MPECLGTLALRRIGLHQPPVRRLAQIVSIDEAQCEFDLLGTRNKRYEAIKRLNEKGSEGFAMLRDPVIDRRRLDMDVGEKGTATQRDRVTQSRGICRLRIACKDVGIDIN